MLGAEIGPQGFDEVELRICRFPQQEVRQALFATCADEQIDIAAGFGLRRSEETAESLARGRMICPASVRLRSQSYRARSNREQFAD
jgi:hypothetical protein